VNKRVCGYLKDNGERCGATPMVDLEFCFWHDPSTAEDAANARRLGGMNRRKEKTLQAVYDIEGLESVPQIRRVLEHALNSELALENSHNRSRVLITVAGAAAKLLETGEFSDRLEALEGAIAPRQQKQEPKKRWGIR
jgi:hypothetical protein